MLMKGSDGMGLFEIEVRMLLCSEGLFISRVALEGSCIAGVDVWCDFLLTSLWLFDKRIFDFDTSWITVLNILFDKHNFWHN